MARASFISCLLRRFKGAGGGGEGVGAGGAEGGGDGSAGGGGEGVGVDGGDGSGDGNIDESILVSSCRVVVSKSIFGLACKRSLIDA